jgi:hypothetical protein
MQLIADTRGRQSSRALGHQPVRQLVQVGERHGLVLLIEVLARLLRGALDDRPLGWRERPGFVRLTGTAFSLANHVAHLSFDAGMTLLVVKVEATLARHRIVELVGTRVRGQGEDDPAPVAQLLQAREHPGRDEGTLRANVGTPGIVVALDEERLALVEEHDDALQREQVGEDLGGAALEPVKAVLQEVRRREGQQRPSERLRQRAQQRRLAGAWRAEHEEAGAGRTARRVVADGRDEEVLEILGELALRGRIGDRHGGRGGQIQPIGEVGPRLLGSGPRATLDAVLLEQLVLAVRHERGAPATQQTHDDRRGP